MNHVEKGKMKRLRSLKPSIGQFFFKIHVQQRSVISLQTTSAARYPSSQKRRMKTQRILRYIIVNQQLRKWNITWAFLKKQQVFIIFTLEPFQSGNRIMRGCYGDIKNSWYILVAMATKNVENHINGLKMMAIGTTKIILLMWSTFTRDNKSAQANLDCF